MPPSPLPQAHSSPCVARASAWPASVGEGRNQKDKEPVVQMHVLSRTHTHTWLTPTGMLLPRSTATLEGRKACYGRGTHGWGCGAQSAVVLLGASSGPVCWCSTPTPSRVRGGLGLPPSVSSPESWCATWWGRAAGVPRTEHSFPRPRLPQPTEFAGKPGPETQIWRQSPTLPLPAGVPTNSLRPLPWKWLNPPNNACSPGHCPFGGPPSPFSLFATIPSHKHMGHGQMPP